MSWSPNAFLRVSVVSLVLAVGCQSAPTSGPEPIALTTDALSSSNGIAMNGIAMNGMLTNGLSPGDGTNGLAENGLVESSLQTEAFQGWFAKDAAYSDMVMTYVARCAIPEGQTLAYATDEASYAWAGTFGLAPAWTSGQAIGQTEQELVSACLAAHTNGFGRHVSISVRGWQADGQAIAVTDDEVANYTFREACFFGNLFTGPGTFMALEQDSLDPVVSTPRGCAAEFGQPTPCSPMVHAGSCADLCQAGADGETWSGCTANGVTYRPLRVFLSAPSVHHCGDGVCDAPAETADTCPADCATP